MSQPLHILLIEDSEVDAELLLEQIRHAGYEPIYRRIDTAAATLDALTNEAWEIVISDYTMPQYSGLDALKLVKQHDPDLPFIISSGNIGEDIAVEAMRAGAHDYVMKSNLSRLVPAIERELRESKIRHTARRAQRAHEEDEARFTAIVANIPGVVFQLRREQNDGYRFSYISAGSTQLLALSPKSLQDDATLFFDRVQDGWDKLETCLADSANNMQPLGWEGQIRVASSTHTKWIEIRAQPRPLPGGSVQWDGIMENISPRKLSETELQHSQQRLSALSNHLQKAKETERTHIAREVHDNIGGNLTALKIDLLWLSSRLDKKQLDMINKAHAIESLVDHTMEIASRISRDLRPPLLELGLLVAIEWAAAEFQERMGIPCIVSCKNKELPVEPDLGNAAFSIFQEILTNTSKHANATKVEVQLSIDDTMLIMKVTDNGRGMLHSDLLKIGSYGLRGMLERARNLGGEIRFDSGLNIGTIITALLPLDPHHQLPSNVTFEQNKFAFMESL